MDKEILDMTFKFIIALAVIIGPIVQIWVQRVIAAKVADRVHEVKVKLDSVEEVKNEQAAALAKITQDTHTLVNSNFGIQLALHAKSARKLANLTNDPVDILVADTAEADLQDHITKQKIVDSV